MPLSLAGDRRPVVTWRAHGGPACPTLPPRHATLAAALLSSPLAAEPRATAASSSPSTAGWTTSGDGRGDWLERSYEALARTEDRKGLPGDHRSRSQRPGDHAEGQALLREPGIKTAGGITLVADEGREFKQFSYTSPPTEARGGVVRFTASLFDELILDDFFFTTTRARAHPGEGVAELERLPPRPDEGKPRRAWSSARRRPPTRRSRS